MDIETAKTFLSEYGYWALFIGVLMDQSGFPLWIVLAGTFSYFGIMNFAISFTVIIISLIVTDIFWYCMGRYIREKHQKPFYSSRYVKNSFSARIYRMLLKGTEIFCSRKRMFYLMSKPMPVVGKFAPLFSGYTGDSMKFSFTMFMAGNLIYCMLFLLAGYLLGNSLLNHSVQITILLTVLFVLLFIITTRDKQKKYRFW